MQRYPGVGFKEHYSVEEEEDFTFKDDYGKGSSMQMKPAGGHCVSQPGYDYHSHNRHGYDDKCDSFKDGREGYSVHYSEAWYEKEPCDDGWNGRRDYPGHGGKYYHGYENQSNLPHIVGVKHGGYEANHHGAQHHGYRGEYKPFWNPKAIVD